MAHAWVPQHSKYPPPSITSVCFSSESQIQYSNLPLVSAILMIDSHREIALRFCICIIVYLVNTNFWWHYEHFVACAELSVRKDIHSVWLKFSGGGGQGWWHLQNPLPLRTTFAFIHPLFWDVSGEIPWWPPSTTPLEASFTAAPSPSTTSSIKILIIHNHSPLIFNVIDVCVCVCVCVWGGGGSESITLSYRVVCYFVCFCVLTCICQFEIKQPIESVEYLKY